MGLAFKSIRNPIKIQVQRAVYIEAELNNLLIKGDMTINDYYTKLDQMPCRSTSRHWPPRLRAELGP